MFVPLRILASSVAVLLAGCATPGPSPRSLTPLPEVSIATAPADSARGESAPPTPESQITVMTLVETEPPQPATPGSPPLPTATLPTPPSPPAKPTLPAIAAWVDAIQWSEDRGLGRWQRVGTSAEPVFEFLGHRGVFTFSPGSRNLRWNGLLIGLGYPPRLVNNRLQVHGLDLEHNVLPLLDPDPPPPGQGRTVVIDPGHGGSNGGTRNVFNGRPEKDYTLDWALRMKPLLETNGWQVCLTRTNDIELDLPSRIAFADQVNADLFISLHFNTAAPNPGPAGIETYCVTPVGLPSNLTRSYADPIDRLFPNNAFDALNLQFAVRMHRAILGATDGLDRGVRRARFMDVLTPHRRPAILIEGGYFSNPREARLAANPDHRQKLAVAVANAIGPALVPRVSPPASSDQ